MFIFLLFPKPFFTGKSVHIIQKCSWSCEKMFHIGHINNILTKYQSTRAHLVSVRTVDMVWKKLILQRIWKKFCNILSSQSRTK